MNFTSHAAATGPTPADGQPVVRPERLLTRLKFALLTRDRRQQIRLSQAGLANLLMLGCVTMANVLGGTTIADTRWIPAWTVFSVGGMLAIFALIRSGRVTHWRDPSLTLPQMFYAISCAAIAYCITDSARGVVIPILAVILMFGMFGMTQRQVMVVGIYTLAAFGAGSFYWLQVAAPAPEARSELARLTMVAIVIAGVLVLTGRLQHMRERLRSQHRALADALVRIGELATRDELTGCFNRRAMIERLSEEALRSARSGTALCVVLLDLDHFKRINDSFGHAAGDEVLRGFAEIARSRLRGTDVLARWGGEEFLLMLGSTDAAHAEPCVQRLLDSVAEARFPCLSGQTVVTCSAGLAESRGGESIAAVIERSDRALYRAKDQGRNRLMTAA